MKALILAAGYATRLYPLTKNLPKPLLKVGDNKVIEHIISKIESVKDIDEIFIVTNEKFYPEFNKWLNNYKSSKKIEIISDGTLSNEDRLGSIGDIEFVVKSKALQDDLLVVAGDNLFEFSLNKFVDFFKIKNNYLVALCDLKDKNKIKNTFGCVELKNDSIIGFEEKPNSPRSSIAAIACYVYPRRHLQDLFIKNSCTNFENIEGIINKFIVSSEINGYVFSEDWFDIGSFELLEQARKRYSS